MGGQQSSRGCFVQFSATRATTTEGEGERGLFVRASRQMLAISLYPYILSIPIGRLHAGSPCLHMFFTSLCFGTMPKPKGQTEVLVFSLIYWCVCACVCVCVCVCCHCLAYFAVFYVISRLTYWFQCAPSPVSRFRPVKISAWRRPALGGPAWADPGSQCRLRLGLVLVHDLFASPVAILTAATRTTALILLHSSPRNRHSPHASQGCNSQPAPLISATRRVPLRVSATISGIYCLTSRMQIVASIDGLIRALVKRFATAVHQPPTVTDRLSMPSILICAQ